jgi:hypothetical protein
MQALTPAADGTYSASFVPRLRLGMELLGAVRQNQEFVVTTLSSVRLVFLTSIAAAGGMLGKERKDGEVIARDIAIKCTKPLLYTARSRIPVSVTIDVRRRTKDFALFRSTFHVGPNSEHEGMTTLLYCRPNLTNFSYLKASCRGAHAAPGA